MSQLDALTPICSDDATEIDKLRQAFAERVAQVQVDRNHELRLNGVETTCAKQYRASTPWGSSAGSEFDESCSDSGKSSPITYSLALSFASFAVASWTSYVITGIFTGSPLPCRGFKLKRYHFVQSVVQQLTFVSTQEFYRNQQQLVRRQVDANGFHSYFNAPEDACGGGAVPHDCNQQ